MSKRVHVASIFNAHLLKCLLLTFSLCNMQFGCHTDCSASPLYCWSVVSPITAWTKTTKCFKVQLLLRRLTPSNPIGDCDVRPLLVNCRLGCSLALVPVTFLLLSSRRRAESVDQRVSFLSAETWWWTGSCYRDSTRLTRLMTCSTQALRQWMMQSPVCWFLFWTFSDNLKKWK